ncbi:MAG: GNAT family N-acetyltransferase, partial [Ginsengibacter sp.]
MIVFRPMTDNDIAAGMVLCRAAGWNQLARDWEILLHLNPDGCRVATINNKVIGTVTAIRYEKFFSWIGMVLVDPAFRGRGTGMQLLDEALRVLQNEETIKLDATPAGRKLYLKLNFVD